MSQGLKMRQMLLVSALGFILLFQNCSQAPTESNEEASFEVGLPFAYKAGLDTISYMSCSGMKSNRPDKRGYYTIRAGAYNNATGGLSLTNEYRDGTKYYDQTQRSRLLSLSEKNANTLLSLSIRSTANYQTPWTEGNILPGEELDAMLPALDSQGIGGPLSSSQPNQMINYFPGGHSKRLMEGSIRFYDFENVMKDTRNNLNARESLLVLGYSATADLMDTGLRSPVEQNNRAYGTGYHLSFGLPFGYSAGEQRVMSAGSGVEEIDLTTGQPQSSNWDCSTNYQFMVVRPEDKQAGRVACDAIVDKFNNNSERAALNAIRRVLPVEDWFVDVARKCIMPKRTGDFCYGEVQSRTIQYGLASCLNSGTTMCPHFVSVCIKR